MVSAKTYKLIKFPVILPTLAILIFGFLCLGIFHKMPVHMATMDNISMSAQNEQPCCGTTITQYLESWKNTFLAIPREIRDTLVSLALGLILAFAFSRLPFHHTSANQKRLSYRLYERQNPDIVLFNHLRLAFARGILNPKIY